MTTIRSAILFATVMFGASSALAQGNPSRQKMMQDLQLGPRLDPTGRGIVMNGQPSGAPAVRAPEHGTAQPSRSAAGRTAPPATTPRAPSVNLIVQFASNSAILTPAATHTLDDLGSVLSSPSLAGNRFRIEGHTDTVGSPEANKSLSERRAAAVVDYLASKFSIDRARLEAAGMGEDGLLIQTPPQRPEPRNRRVQVINLGA